MKRYFDHLKKDRLILRLYIATFVLILVTAIYILVNYSKLPPLIPIYNQLPWGVERLSSTLGIFIPSVLTVFMLILNTVLSAISYSTSPLISRLIAITTFLTTLLTFLFIIRTIQLII